MSPDSVGGEGGGAGGGGDGGLARAAAAGGPGEAVVLGRGPAPAGDALPGADPPDDGAAERLVALAHDILRARGGEGARAVADLALLREEIDRIARLRDDGLAEDEMLAAVRRGLGAAGLGGLAPSGATLAVIQAGLARLHRLVAALAVTAAGRSA